MALIPAPTDILFVALALCLPFVWNLPLLNADGDPARHLRLGEEMLRRGGLIERDFFSISRAGAPFLPFEWGSQVLFAAANRLGGLAAVTILASLLIASAYLIIGYFLRARGADPLLTLLAVFAAVALGPVHWVARPHLFTFVCTGFLLWLLESPARARVLILAPLFAVWANLHGGFVYGFILIAAYCLGDVLEIRYGVASGWVARLHYHVTALGVAAIASLATPFGVRLWAHVLGFLGGEDYIKAGTVEFLSPDFHRLPAQLFLLAILVIIGGFALGRGRPCYPHLLAILVSCAFALISRRNIPLFGLVAVPLFALWADSEWRRLRSPWLLRARAAVALGQGTGRAGVWPMAAFAVLAMLALTSGHVAGSQLIPDRFSPAIFPVEAVARARAAGLQGRLFNDFTWGGYLLYAWPEQKVYIDGGTDHYGGALMKEYDNVVTLKPGWRDTLDRRNVDLMLLPSDSPLTAEVQRDVRWRTWYSDSTATILQRREFLP